MKPATHLADIPPALLMGTSAAVATVEDVPPFMDAPASARRRLVDLYETTKPRMNFLIVATTGVGYFMAQRQGAQWGLLAHTLIGTALTAAGASVMNQYIEREHDSKMNRTADRPMAAGRLGPAQGLVWGVMLAVLGLLDLLLFVNGLTATLGAITLGSYVFLYTPLKRMTTLCTIVGAIPGAIPPMMGVTAVEGAISHTALLLFFILFLWQMPHFLAIAILYCEDYARGGFKMLPVIDHSGPSTARQIVVYSMALIPVTLMPTLFHVAGTFYFVAALLMGLAFLGFGIVCALHRGRTEARQLFFASIVYLPCLLGMMMIDKL